LPKLIFILPGEAFSYVLLPTTNVTAPAGILYVADVAVCDFGLIVSLSSKVAVADFPLRPAISDPARTGPAVPSRTIVSVEGCGGFAVCDNAAPADARDTTRTNAETPSARNDMKTPLRFL
jgi:hypothetical protein